MIMLGNIYDNTSILMNMQVIMYEYTLYKYINKYASNNV